MPLYAVGWVDEASQKVITPIAIPGGTSFLASGSFDTEYPGLNDLAKSGAYGSDFTEETISELPVNTVFQSYHLMVAMFGLIGLTTLLAFIFTFRKGRIASMRWLQKLFVISPLFPFVAIQVGWITAEVGRQPWVVYPSTTGPDGVALLTNDAISQSVSAPELLITLGLFLAVYLFLLIGWMRVISHFVKQGPDEGAAKAADGNLAVAGAGEKDGEQ